MATLASNTTPNVGLSQWAAEDFVRREDFNADNALLDAAISLCPKYETGTYAGTGVLGSANPNVISFDITPQLVVVTCSSSTTESQVHLCVFLREAKLGSLTNLKCAWENNSISWYDADSATDQLNRNGLTYTYLALGY